MYTAFLYRCVLLAVVGLVFPPQWTVAEELSPITSIRRIHQLTETEAAKQPPAKIKATVTYYKPEHFRFFVQDGEEAIYVFTENADKNDFKQLPIQVGDLLELKGKVHPGHRSPYLLLESFRMIRTS